VALTTILSLFFYPIDSSSVVAQTIYSSTLNTKSSKYNRDCTLLDYYYEAIQVNVVEDGIYTFGSDSTMNTYGHIYKGKFNPFDPSMNQVQRDDDSGCNSQFKMVTYLEKNTTYILVVTTSSAKVTGSFSIIAFGPNNVTLTYTSK